MAFWNRKKKGKASDKAPRFETLRSQNMVLRVAAPVGEGWQRMEANAQGGMLAGFKCLHGAPPDALALDAVLYEITEGMPQDVAALEKRDWREHYLGGMFGHINTLQHERLQHYDSAGFPVDAIELNVAGDMRDPAQPLQLRERYALFEGKLLVISVAGAPELHEAFALVVASWLGHCTLEQ